MLIRGPLGRILLAIVLVAVGAVAVVGALALPPPGLITTGVVGLLVACLAVGRARESTTPRRRSTAEEAALAACLTVTAVLFVAGIAVLAGGLVAGVLTGVTVFVAVAVPVARAVRRTGSPGRPVRRPAPPTRAVPWYDRSATPLAGRTGDGAGLVPLLSPVVTLTTGALGREWLLSTSALGVSLDPLTRQSIVRRRQDMLDELERRDPVGFARWLAAGPVPGSDPADYLRDDPADADAA